MIHHSLTLKFCDIRRTNADPFLETVTACLRMRHIKRMANSALKRLREVFKDFFYIRYKFFIKSDYAGDGDFNLDFFFEGSKNDKKK